MLAPLPQIVLHRNAALSLVLRLQVESLLPIVHQPKLGHTALPLTFFFFYSLLTLPCLLLLVHVDALLEIILCPTLNNLAGILFPSLAIFSCLLCPRILLRLARQGREGALSNTLFLLQ